jgi:hypothetical protein
VKTIIEMELISEISNSSSNQNEEKRKRHYFTIYEDASLLRIIQKDQSI